MAAGRSGELGAAATSLVRLGAVLLVLGTIEFVAGMIIAQVGYGPSYSLSTNLISDLGVTSCGLIDDTGRSACSPWWFVFDGSLILFGALVLAGMLLVRPALPPGGAAAGATSSLAFNGFCVLIAGVFPENVDYSVHSSFALAAFFAAGLGLISLSWAIVRSTTWRREIAVYTGLSGVWVWIALALFVSGNDLGLGPGGVERALVVPVLLWFSVLGLLVVGGREPVQVPGPGDPPREIASHSAP